MSAPDSLRRLSSFPFRAARGAALAACVAAAFLASACSHAGPTAEITETRAASQPSSPVLPGATPRQRFPGMGGDMGHDAASDGASDDVIDYDLPSGWMAVAPTSDRMINLRPAGDPEASCYLSFLGGSAGGLVANVNRWRKQFGVEPLDDAAVAALPTLPLLGRDATLVEVEGTFAGMGEGAPRPGFALLGLLVSESGGSLFLKFTGPAPLVALERERFLAFARSLRLAESHGGSAGAMGAPPSSGGASGGLRWTAPAGWTEQAPRAMREVTLSVPGGGECYIARLASDAGGLRPNLDRWSNQVGRGPLSDEAFAALPKVEMLGQSVPVLELEGDFSGMDGNVQAGQGLLGVACIRSNDSLFVKLTGPESVVRAAREDFLAFVRSLEEGH